MSVKFNDEHIPDSPFRVPVVPSTGAARLVTVQALKQKGLEVNTYYQISIAIVYFLHHLMLWRSKENCQNVESCLLTSTDETTCVGVYILMLDWCGLFRQYSCMLNGLLCTMF